MEIFRRFPPVGQARVYYDMACDCWFCDFVFLFFVDLSCSSLIQNAIKVVLCQFQSSTNSLCKELDFCKFSCKSPNFTAYFRKLFQMSQSHNSVRDILLLESCKPVSDMGHVETMTGCSNRFREIL